MAVTMLGLLVIASIFVQSAISVEDLCTTIPEFFAWFISATNPEFPIAADILEKPKMTYITNDTYGPGAKISLKELEIHLGHIDDPSIEFDDANMYTALENGFLGGVHTNIFLTTHDCDYLNHSEIYNNNHGIQSPDGIVRINNVSFLVGVEHINQSIIAFNASETLRLHPNPSVSAYIELPENCKDFKRYCIQVSDNTLTWNNPLTCYPFDENLPWCGMIENAPVQVTGLQHYRFVPNQKILNQPSINHVNTAQDSYSFLMDQTECDTGITKSLNDIFVVDTNSTQSTGHIKVKVNGVNMQCEKWAKESYRPLVVKIHTNSTEVPTQTYLGRFRLCDVLPSKANTTDCEFSCPCDGNICNQVFVDFLSMATPSVSSICQITVTGDRPPPSESFLG